MVIRCESIQQTQRRTSVPILSVYPGEQAILMSKMKTVFSTIIFLLLSLSVSAQQYIGLSGMIHVPTADMDTVGIARIGAHFIPKAMMPTTMKLDGESYNSLTNYLTITPFRWIQLSYGYTLQKCYQDDNPQKKTGFYTKDRYFSIKLQPLQEGKWWPSVVIGGNDVWGSYDSGESYSDFYKNFFIATSKHIDIKGNIIGGHLTYRKWDKEFNHKWNGVVGGVTFQPKFYRPLRAIAEWDGNEVNIGADCLLFKYFLVQCALLDFRHFNAGLCIYYPLL